MPGGAENHFAGIIETPPIPTAVQQDFAQYLC
jgi:hypothetical protein